MEQRPASVNHRQVEVADLRQLPRCINGYIPIPGQPWQEPTDIEIAEAVQLAENFPNNVKYAHLASEEALDLTVCDDRFKVKIIARV